MSFYSQPNVSGNSGELQYNNNGVLSGTSGINYESLKTLLKTLSEAEAIRLQGSYSIGVPGTVPFGVGPVAGVGQDLAPLDLGQYNVVDIKSGSFC